jgi:hypothetical protein
LPFVSPSGASPGAEPEKLITNSIGMKLVLIPAGEFQMGSRESPEELAKAFKDYGGRPPSAFKRGEYPLHHGSGPHHYPAPDRGPLASDLALLQLLATWNDPLLRFAARKASLESTYGTGLSSIVEEDGDPDVLTGASGEDRFIAGLGDVVTDSGKNK